MSLYYKNNWKSTCGLMISIDNGALYESEETYGFTHLAEHLMFSGTNKFSREYLEDKFGKIFNELEATTSRDEVKIFCYFNLGDFDEVIEILKEQIFNWKLDKKHLKEEKKLLTDEMKEYFSSYDFKMRSYALKSLKFSRKQILGSLEKMEKLKFGDIGKVKRCWDEFLKNSNMRYVAIGDLSQTQIRKLDKNFNNNKVKFCPKQETIGKFNLVERAKATILWAESQNPHYYFLLLDKIFYWRWCDRANEYDFDYNTSFEEGKIAFALCNEKGINKNKSRDFFLKKITKKEFERSKELFLSYYRRVLDVVDTLYCFNGFIHKNYAGLKSQDPKKIYKQFEEIDFADFKKFVDSSMKDVKM